MTVSRLFLDTNVLVYTVSRGVDEKKQRLALELLDSLATPGGAVISPQVIAEFLSVCRKPAFSWVTPQEALERADGFVMAFEMVPLDVRTTVEALRACSRYRLDYFDAQIWAAARMHGCDVILTEDVHGEQIEGVRYVNPFEPGFAVESLLAG